MFAPKWVRGPHNLACFPSWEMHYPWVLSVVFKCFANIRISDLIAFLNVHTPRGHIYLRFLFCAVPVFVAEHGLGSCRYPSLCSGSRSSVCDTSFELPFIAWVAFRLDFMAGIILHFIFEFIACVASSCFIVYVAFSCYGMCRLHVVFSRRVWPSN